MARWLILCGLLGLGLMMGCVSEVDLQVLRADVETLQQNYRRHDAQVARQLERLETRKAQSRQVLTPLTATIVELRAEVQRLDTALGDLQDTVHNADFTDDMQEELSQFEARLTQVKRHTSTKKKPAAHRQKPQTAPSSPVARKKPAEKPPPAKPKTPPLAAPNPSSPTNPTVAKVVNPAPVKPTPDTRQPADPTASAEAAKTATLHANSPPPAPPQPSQAAPAPPSDGSDVRLYERGLRAYQIGDYESALEFLRHFLKQYTQSPLAGNVQYWIGESLLAQHQYKAAIAAFDHVVQKYPNDTKVPAAMLNQGLAFVQLQDVQRARFFLEQVQKKYADSLEADQAKATLQQIK